MKICDLYGVDPKVVLSDFYTCPICGMAYDSSDTSDIESHREHHDKFESAKKYFEVCLNSVEVANIKAAAYDVLYSDKSSEEDQYNAALDLLKSYFSRSLSANSYSLNHPHFNDYVAMILNNQEWASTFGVKTMNALIEKFGKLEGLQGKTTTYRATKNAKHLPLDSIPYTRGRQLPILGSIPAGVPVLAYEDVEGYEYADVPEKESYFFLRVNGNSMINAHIYSGDLVLVKMQDCAENGQVVVCLVNGDEATLKRFYCHGDSVILQPENPEFRPISVSCEDFETGYAKIIGVATEVRHRI